MGEDQISGKWMNVNTGQVVYARNIINDGTEAQVVTDIGVIPMTEFMDFVQMGEEEVGQAMPASTTSFNNSSMMSAEDAKLLANINNPVKQQEEIERPRLDMPLTSTQTSKIEVETRNTPIEEPTIARDTPNRAIISKLFSKFPDKAPKVSVTVEWNDFPMNQIQTLIDIFDVPKREIAEYIKDNYMSHDNIVEKISELI